MSAQQQAVFTTTSTVNPADLTLSVASVLMTAALLWLAWMAYSQVRLWHSKQTSFYDLSITITRSSIIVLLLGFIVR